MKLKHLFPLAVIAFALPLAFASCSDDSEDDGPEESRDVVGFESVQTGDNNVTSMTEGANYFSIFGFQFNSNQTTSEYGGVTYVSWDGFRVSSSTSTTFNDFNDFMNSCVGHGYDNSAKFAVYYPAYGTPSTIDMPDPTGYGVSGFYGAVNAYVEHSLLNGDGFAHKFDTGDWFRLDCIGIKSDNSQDTISYYLADYRSQNASDHYYVRDWTWFDLSKLGDVKKIYFSFDSSDKSEYGINTPTYVLIDNFNGIYDNKSARAVEATR